jgi:hypothetical protein
MGQPTVNRVGTRSDRGARTTERFLAFPEPSPSKVLLLYSDAGFAPGILESVVNLAVFVQKWPKIQHFS